MNWRLDGVPATVQHVAPLSWLKMSSPLLIWSQYNRVKAIEYLLCFYFPRFGVLIERQRLHKLKYFWVMEALYSTVYYHLQSHLYLVIVQCTISIDILINSFLKRQFLSLELVSPGTSPQCILSQYCNDRKWLNELLIILILRSYHSRCIHTFVY